MRYRGFKSGWTLVELLIAVAITAVLMVVVASTIFIAFDSRQEMHQVGDLQQAGQLLSSQITRDIRHSSSASTNSEGNMLVLIPNDTSTYLQKIYIFLDGTLWLFLVNADSSVSQSALIGGTDDPVSITGGVVTIRTLSVTDDHDDDPDTADQTSELPTLVTVVLELTNDDMSIDAVSSGTLRGNLVRARAADNMANVVTP